MNEAMFLVGGSLPDLQAAVVAQLDTYQPVGPVRRFENSWSQWMVNNGGEITDYTLFVDDNPAKLVAAIEAAGLKVLAEPKSAYSGRYVGAGIVGTPAGGGGGEGGPTAWDDITGKPAVIAAGEDAEAARAAIGAGTSDLELGTTSSTALAGDTVIPPAYTLPNASAGTRGGVLQGAAVSDPADETEVEAQLGALLASLRAAGVIAS